MMTGQILGGSPVVEAAHYQILITYMIATCYYSVILFCALVMYMAAFDRRSHVLRIDRFTEVGGRNFIAQCLIRVGNCCEQTLPCCGSRRKSTVGDEMPETRQLTKDPETTYESCRIDDGSKNIISSNVIEIRTRQLNGSEMRKEILFQISNLQYSVPKRHMKKRVGSSSSLSQMSHLDDPELDQHRRILCTDMSVSLNKGEVGIVSGVSGSGKSTLLRVLSGLTPMDHGDVRVSELSLRSCVQDGTTSMLQWRTAVRYVTQYKVDIPGSPRDFILKISSYCLQQSRDSKESCTPSANGILSQAMSYLNDWSTDHDLLDKEWKELSGGESQRTLLAIAMASRPSVLLLDEATSGLDAKTEKLLEKSIVDYARTNDAAVLWVTHSEDIAERILTL